MNILIIEDDDYKAENLTGFVRAKFKQTNVKVVTSLVEAINCINKNSYSYVFIDMAIPSHPVVHGEGSPMSLLTGGLDVILELKRLDRQDLCVIITQYPEVEIDEVFISVGNTKQYIKENFNFEILECIEYINENDSWKKALDEALSFK